jgi:hypothetical protein
MIEEESFDVSISMRSGGRMESNTVILVVTRGLELATKTSLALFGESRDTCA